MKRTRESTSGGRPHRPEGEGAGRHTGTTGEESRLALAKDSTHTSAVGEQPPVGTDVDSLVRFTRATARIRVEPWRIAQDAGAHAKRECGPDCRACALLRGLDRAQADCARALNAAVRALWQSDGAFLDEFVAREGRSPRGGEWPMPRLNLYALVRRVSPDLASGVAATLSHAVHAKWRQTRFDALVRLSCSPPHYRRDLPIPLRTQGMRFATRPEGGYSLSFSLAPGRHPGGMEFCVPLSADDARQRGLLDALAAGTYRLGEAKIEQDRRRRSRWYVRLSYTRAVPASAGDQVGAINRGIVCFLAAVSSSGDRWLYDGTDIVQTLRQFQERRKRFQRDSKASARWGHGRDRTLAPLIKLEDAGQRWRATKCQTIARRVAEWFRDQRVSTVAIEDFNGIRRGAFDRLGEHVGQLVQEWPYFQLQTRLIACLEEYGIRTVVESARDITRQCRECAHTDEANVNLERRWFACLECGAYSNHLDVHAAQNVLHRAFGFERSGAAGWTHLQKRGDGEQGGHVLDERSRESRQVSRKRQRKSRAVSQRLRSEVCVAAQNGQSTVGSGVACRNGCGVRCALRAGPRRMRRCRRSWSQRLRSEVCVAGRGPSGCVSRRSTSQRLRSEVCVAGRARRRRRRNGCGVATAAE